MSIGAFRTLAVDIGTYSARATLVEFAAPPFLDFDEDPDPLGEVITTRVTTPVTGNSEMLRCPVLANREFTSNCYPFDDEGPCYVATERLEQPGGPIWSDVGINREPASIVDGIYILGHASPDMLRGLPHLTDMLPRIDGRVISRFRDALHCFFGNIYTHTMTVCDKRYYVVEKIVLPVPAHWDASLKKPLTDAIMSLFLDWPYSELASRVHFCSQEDALAGYLISHPTLERPEECREVLEDLRDLWTESGRPTKMVLAEFGAHTVVRTRYIILPCVNYLGALWLSFVPHRVSQSVRYAMTKQSTRLYLLVIELVILSVGASPHGDVLQDPQTTN